MSHDSVVDLEIQGDVAWVTINNPPVNATSTAVRAGLVAAIQGAQNARVAILCCAGKTFVAGGDMSEFDAPPALPHLPDVVQMIEDSAVPFIAAMHGTVLGGGFELALGCAWRIAQVNTRFGLPEVNVGLIPGAGGTQRLPRLVGMDLAIDIAASGKVLTAQDLQDAGGLDHVFDEDLQSAVRKFLQDLPVRPQKLGEKSVTALPEPQLEAKRLAIEKRARGQKSPLHNFDAITWSITPFSTGQKRERGLHLDLRNTAESRALRHAFFAERKVARPEVIEGVSAKPINSVVIVGGGLMGAGIATSILSGGMSVTIIEQDAASAAAAIQRVVSNLNGALSRGKIDENTFAQQKSRVKASADYEDARGHDLAIEAVFEDCAAKQDVMSRLAAVMAPDAVLATNTSYLDPRDIFDGIAGSERCIGLHFFSPAHIMKLLEVVSLPQTSASTISTCFAFAKRLRKVSVLSGICDGFIGNRMLAAYRRAAEYMIADGALPQDIDAAMKDFGMAMGPFEAQDMSGLHIAFANRRRLDSTRSPSERYVDIADKICAQKRFGQRSGNGWYIYKNDGRQPIIDPVVTQMILAYSDTNGITRTPFAKETIQRQLLSVLANEGALIVEEGIAESDDVIDMVKLHGYGFPRWRGGPMQTAKELGHSAIQKAFAQVAASSPQSWTVSQRFSGK